MKTELSNLNYFTKLSLHGLTGMSWDMRFHRFVKLVKSHGRCRWCGETASSYMHKKVETPSDLQLAESLNGFCYLRKESDNAEISFGSAGN